MSHPADRRPFREPDFPHDLRPRPVRARVGDRPRGEWARRRLQRTQERGHARQLALAESRAGVADVGERPTLPYAEQQRAEVRAAAAALRPAADDTLLAAQNLDLAPRRAAPPLLVGRVQLLGDEALPTAVQHAPV